MDHILYDIHDRWLLFLPESIRCRCDKHFQDGTG